MVFFRVEVQESRVFKAGVYLKMSGKSDFLFSLELASSTIYFTLVRVVLGYFQNFHSNEPFTYKRCMNCSSLPWQRKVFFFF